MSTLPTSGGLVCCWHHFHENPSLNLVKHRILISKNSFLKEVLLGTSQQFWKFHSICLQNFSIFSHILSHILTLNLQFAFPLKCFFLLYFISFSLLSSHIQFTFFTTSSLSFDLVYFHHPVSMFCLSIEICYFFLLF